MVVWYTTFSKHSKPCMFTEEIRTNNRRSPPANTHTHAPTVDRTKRGGGRLLTRARRYAWWLWGSGGDGMVVVVAGRSTLAKYPLFTTSAAASSTSALNRVVETATIKSKTLSTSAQWFTIVANTLRREFLATALLYYTWYMPRPWGRSAALTFVIFKGQVGGGQKLLYCGCSQNKG